MKPRVLCIAAVAACLCLSAAQAAIVVSKDTTAQSLIPGLTGFATSGAQMDGLLITATFSGGLTQTVAWADTGASSGGVSGTGWSLSLSGDTFSAPWNFSFGANNTVGQLISLTLDASGPSQVTIFDTTSPSPGTPDSASGADFAIQSGCSGCNGTAIYSDEVGISPNAPVGDLFHTLTVSFTGGSGPRTDFSFRQDTDNDSRLITGFVPEPGSIALAGLALALLGATRRRSAV